MTTFSYVCIFAALLDDPIYFRLEICHPIQPLLWTMIIAWATMQLWVVSYRLIFSLN